MTSEAERVKNITLLDKINKGEKNILNMSDTDLIALKNIIIYNAENNKEVSKKCFQQISSLFDFSYEKPFWFNQKSNFQDNIWVLNINDLDEKIIDFSKITLEDNSYLIMHPKLLNSFKIWIVNQGNPIYFSGKVPSRHTLAANINKVLALIDYIILHSKNLTLAQSDLTCLDENFIYDLMVQLATYPVNEAVYNYKKAVSNYLINNIKNISINDVRIFEHRFPLTCEILEDELDLNFDQKRKARYFLYQQKAYYRGADLISKPNTRYFNFLFSNTLSAEHRIFESLSSLTLYQPMDTQEYPAIPTRTQFEEDGLCDQNIDTYIKQFHILGSINDYDFCTYFERNNLRNITPQRIRQQVNMKPLGRHSTLPADVIFPCVKNAYEFIFKYLDPIFETIYQCYIYEAPLSKKNNLSLDLGFLKNEYWKTIIAPELEGLGIKSFHISDRDPQKFVKRRRNECLCTLYDVLIGAILIVLGTISARRQHEIIDLIEINNLVPSNIEPELNKNINFELKFLNRKSGTYFLQDSREELSRPIINSVAQIVYKLEIFNKKIQTHSTSKIKISLINTFNHHSNQFKAIDTINYSRCLDAFCDYFETPVIEYKENDYRRFYVRQHQLRRFFAMLFFWSNSFDGLESIRYFLGHTDTEHLYHYITESVSGEVLNGIKASALVDHLIIEYKDKIENIDKLNFLLSKKLNVRELEILTESSIIDYYPEQSLNYIQKSKLSEQILILLESHKIELQPKFFSVKNKNGELIREYKLVLIIKDEL